MRDRSTDSMQNEARPSRVSELLERGFDSFSRSQKAIARYIIDHLDEIGYLSAEELARKGNTSSSTVVRFAQQLGFSGYPELQKAARDEYRLGASIRPLVREDQLLFPVEEDLLTRALRTDILSLEETLAKNALSAFETAVDLLFQSETILVIGLNEASVIAQHAAYVFELLGYPVALVVDGSEANVAKLVRMGPRDCLLAIGFRRAHSQTVSFLTAAVAQNVRTIAITDNALSELAGKAQVTLFADIDSIFFAHSLVGPLSLVGALGGAVYACDRERFDEHLRTIRARAAESGWLK